MHREFRLQPWVLENGRKCRPKGQDTRVYTSTSTGTDIRKQSAMDGYDWFWLSKDVYLIEGNQETIRWLWLSEDRRILHEFEQCANMIRWTSSNIPAYALDALIQAPLVVNWRFFYGNVIPRGINLIRMDELNVDWKWFPKNRNHNGDSHSKMDWNDLVTNSGMYECVYNYATMKERMNIIKEEMIMKLFHPKNIDKFHVWGHYD